jgi:hypothetical protein
MKASRKVPGTTPTDVAYPSTKKPDHPVKIATRKAVKSLSDAGVIVRQGPKGYPGIFGMVKHSPELVEETIRVARKSGKIGKAVWSELLTGYFAAPDAEYAAKIHALNLQVASLAAEKIPTKTYPANLPSVARSAISTVNGTIRDIRYLRPDITDFASMARAYEIYADIQKLKTGPMYNRKHPRVNRENIDEIAFIAENLEGVRSILPELKKRKSTDSGIIAEMLDSGTKPLLDGIL